MFILRSVDILEDFRHFCWNMLVILGFIASDFSPRSINRTRDGEKRRTGEIGAIGGEKDFFGGLAV